MRRIAMMLSAAGLVLATACQDGSAPSSPEGATLAKDAVGAPIPGRYIVVFKDGVQDVPGLARRLTQEQRGTLRFTYQHALRGFAANLPAGAAAALARNPNVAYIEQSVEMRITDTQNNPPSWGVDRIDQRDLPLSNAYTYSTNGAGITAYILDTGINVTHNDFGGRASVGFDAIGDGQNGIDCNGHGSHVAGTVGGTAYGVAKGVNLVAVRVLDCGGSGSTDGVIAGIDWVTANHAANAVANMSLGGGKVQSLNDAVAASIASGVTYSLSAGNGNFLGTPQNACNNSPASTPQAITVGATTISDAEASFSNYGTCVDILAPGVNIVSAWIGGNSATETISGTSMAAPHVAGAAALHLAANPGSTPAQIASALTSNASLNKISLHTRSRNNGTPNRLLFVGAGAPDPDPDPDPENNPPTAAYSFSCTTLTCSFTDESTDSDGTVVSWKWEFGDGTTSTAQNPTKTYSRPATYTVKLTVKDDDGASGSTSKNVRVRRR